MEMQDHPDNSFVTLTYDDSSLPLTSLGLATLVPTHVQKWLKRLRKKIAPSRVSFYLAWEYGDETFRPHYHVALFGFPSCLNGQTGAGRIRPSWSTCCSQCQLVGETWGHGNVYLGMLETSSAQYICGYVTKKMTRTDDARLKGRWPEFSTMSRHPGIGLNFLHDYASALIQFNLDTTLSDVPVTLRHGSRELPLGNYARRRLRALIGKDEKTPESVLALYRAAHYEAMHLVREAAFENKISLNRQLQEEEKTKLASWIQRQKIHSQKRDLL